MKAIDREETFYFRPYSYRSRGITRAQLFREKNKETNLVPIKASLQKAQTLLVNVSLTLLYCKLEQWESIVVYNPKKMLQQVGYR